MLKLLLLSILLVSSVTSAKVVPATYFKITQNFIEKMVEKHVSHDMGGFLMRLVLFFFFLVVLSAILNLTLRKMVVNSSLSNNKCTNELLNTCTEPIKPLFVHAYELKDEQ
jgi:hypothetical protein